MSEVPRNWTVQEDGFVAESLADCRVARTRRSHTEDLIIIHNGTGKDAVLNIPVF